VDDTSYTPFLDFFLRGEVASDVRMLAAQGALAPRAHEQLALLVLLTSDRDAAIRQTAERTIARIPPEMLSAFLARSDVSATVKTFFEQRGVAGAAVQTVDAERPLVAAEGEELPGPEDELGETAAPGEPGPVAEGPPPNAEADQALKDHEDAIVAAARERIPVVQRLSLMTITERIKVAMRGTREERMVLIRDPNKLVSLTVLSSPKVTEDEVKGFTRMGAISEDVLRVIGHSRSWIKNYGIVAGLAFNPKTPLAISMGLVNRLTERDVKMMSTDRNVPEPLKILARKIVSAGQSRKH
jgi:hypothetical protein